VAKPFKVSSVTVIEEDAVGVVGKSATPVTSDFYISPEAKMVMTTAHQMSLANPGRAVKIMMVGPTGSGKTTLPKLLAQVTGRNFLRMNCATIRDPEEWFGFREAKGGSTVFIPSAFSEAIAKGNLVLVLDEFNRLEPWLHNTLYPLLDDDGFTVVHDQRFEIGSNVLVVATINQGYKYTGTFELDEALTNRFHFTLELGHIPHKEEVSVLVSRTGIEEDIAVSIVKTANTLRAENVSCSTSRSIEVARMVVSGLAVREAFEFAVIRRIPLDEVGGGQRKQAIDMVNNRHGVFSPRILVNDVFGTPAQEKKQEIKEVENKGEGYRISLRVREGEIFRMIQAINLLKLVGINGEQPSVKQAKAVGEALQSGKTIDLYIDGELSLPELATKLAGFGLLVIEGYQNE
jgi:midasin (ATPase involved in ribosome maturation)